MPRVDHNVRLDFKDVLIRPKRSTMRSRSEVKLIRDYEFRNSKRKWSGIPIMASNMDTTGTLKMAVAFAKQKMVVCLHKHLKPQDIIEWAKPNGTLRDDNVTDYIALSAGTSQQDFEKIETILKAVPEISMICLDVANGYSEYFVACVKKYRANFSTQTIIAGNVVTGEMVEELLLAGADLIKVGIGPGSVCTTRRVTGVGYPQLAAILECADAAHGLNGHIVADGGCKNSGDISKAFGAGADFVMCGGMFAGHDESGGELIERGGRAYKSFYGMSSSTAMIKHAGGVANYRASEGKSVEIPYRGPVGATVMDILGGIRSACTYVGAKKLKELSKRTTFIRCTQQLNPSLNTMKDTTKKRNFSIDKTRSRESILKLNLKPITETVIMTSEECIKVNPKLDHEHIRRAKELNSEGSISISSIFDNSETYNFRFKNFDVGTYLVLHKDSEKEWNCIGSFEMTSLKFQTYSWTQKKRHFTVNHFAVSTKDGFHLIRSPPPGNDDNKTTTTTTTTTST